MDETAIVGFALRGRSNGVMIDVGAHHGHTLLSFARRGWRVHAFEPDAANRAILDETVVAFPNVSVDVRAVSDQPGSLTLYGSDESTGISTLTPFTSSHRPVGTVDVITLRDYMRTQRVERVDFLKVDVEGWERNVLDGYPWDEAAPDVVMLEFEDRKTQPLGYGWEDLAKKLESEGYTVLVSEWHPIQAYGTRHRWRSFGMYPTQLADGDAWGNLVGFKPALRSRFITAAWLFGVRQRIADRLPSRR